MWSVGISVSLCMDAERIGYDNRQINRIVIRVAQFFLNRDMRVIFGHDWREEGVMATGTKTFEETACRVQFRCSAGKRQPRMLNVVPTGQELFSRAALEAERDGGGVLVVISTRDGRERLNSPVSGSDEPFREQAWGETRSAELTALRHWITALLDPGCRICPDSKTPMGTKAICQVSLKRHVWRWTLASRCICWVDSGAQPGCSERAICTGEHCIGAKAT